MIMLAIIPQFLLAQWSLVRFDEHNFFTKVVTVTPGSTVIAGIDGVANGSFIMRSNDGGTTWDSIGLNNPVNTYSISEMHFTDVQNGYAGGLKNNSQCLLKTTDNGSTWTEATPDISMIEPLTALSFVNTLSGFVSDGTNLYKTFDGGISFVAGIYN